MIRHFILLKLDTFNLFLKNFRKKTFHYTLWFQFLLKFLYLCINHENCRAWL